MPHALDEAGFSARVLAHASSMLAYWDGSLRCRFANDAYLTWFGIPGSALVGTSLRDLLGPTIFALNEPYILGALAGRPQVFERLIPGPDGVRRHSLARYHPDIVDGEVRGFVAEVSDVSALKALEAALEAEVQLKARAVAALQQKEAALEAAQRLGRSGSWHWEIDPDITTWSCGLYLLFGRDAGQLPPSFADHAQLYAPPSWTRLQQAVALAVSQGIPYALELEYRRADGSYGWLEAHGDVERDGGGSIVALRGNAVDVTEFHVMCAALQGQTRRLALALDAAHLGLVRWQSPEGPLDWDNAQVRAMLGRRTSEGGVRRADRFFAEVVHPEDLAALHAAAARFFVQGAAEFAYTGRFYRRSDGQLRWLEWTGRAAGEGDARAMIGTVLDITESMAASESLRAMVAQLTAIDEHKSAVLSTLGHELRNCITPLSAGLQLLHAKLAVSGAQKIEHIMGRQIGHISRLVDDIFDLRRLQGGALQLKCCPVSLNDVVANALDMCTAVLYDAGHHVTIDLPSPPVLVDGDPVRLTQVLVNLLTNAAKFTPAPGNIGVTLRADQQHAILSVSDDGIGMAADALERVFDLYVQLPGAGPGPRQGLGIGLHLVRQLLELHGGSVRACSAGPGQGSRFIVRLPRLGS